MRRAAAEPQLAARGRFFRWPGCCLLFVGGLEGDGLAGQVLQLADEVALAVPAVGAGLVVAVAEVLVAGVGIGEQVPDDREDGVADGDDRASLAAAPGDAVVSLAEEGIGPGRRGDDLAESGGEPGIALAAGAALGLARGAAVDGGELGPGDLWGARSLPGL